MRSKTSIDSAFFLSLTAIVLALFITPLNASGQDTPYKTITTGHPAHIEFTYVKGGCFHMGDIWGSGSEDEKPVRKVCVDNFYIGTSEVTVSQWKYVMGSTPHEEISANSHPVVYVTWSDARQFISRLNNLSGVKHRLPTEAEWEYAARAGGKDIMYATADGSISASVCNYEENASAMDRLKLSSVKSYPPNKLGLFDMCGNTWEWVEDDYNYQAYSKLGMNNPAYINDSNEKVIRGCGWSDDEEDCRVSARDKVPQDCKHCNRRNDIGFRVAKDN